jgi:hypothetical protein
MASSPSHPPAFLTRVLNLVFIFPFFLPFDIVLSHLYVFFKVLSVLVVSILKRTLVYLLTYPLCTSESLLLKLFLGACNIKLISD